MKTNTANMRSILVVIGFVMTITAITTAGYVYQSFATDLLEKVIYSVFGIVFACLGAIFLPMSGLLWKANHAILSFICAVIWVLCLFVIGTQTHLGFMAYAQNKTENNSAGAQQSVKLKQSQYDNTNTRVISLEKFATIDVASEQAKLADLKANLESERTTLANCPRGYVKNCINPAKANISALQGKIAATENLISNVHAYQAALQTRDNATSALVSNKATPSNNSLDTVHPLFVSQSLVMGIDARKMQSYFLAFSAVSFEALTAIVWLVVSLLIPITAQSQQSMQVKPLSNDFEQALRQDSSLT